MGTGDFRGQEPDGELHKFDRKTKNFTHYVHDPHNPISLSCNSVIKVHIDQSGTLWVGTNGGGLNIFNRETGTFTAYEFDPENPNSFGDDAVFSIYEDRSGILWLGGCCTEISKIF